MKKIFFTALAVVAGVLTLNSCLGENTNEIHETYFYPNDTKIKEMYADQTSDSIYVLSTDSWTGQVTGANSSWMTFTPTQAEVKQGYMLAQRLDMTFTPNTTGKVRVAGITLSVGTSSYGSLYKQVCQTHWLNIVRPFPYTSENTSLQDTQVTFQQTLKGKETEAPLTFTVYSDATLTTDVDWITLPAESNAIKPAKYDWKLPVAPNQTSSDRIGHVTLTSNGVSSIVTYIQEPQK